MSVTARADIDPTNPTGWHWQASHETEEEEDESDPLLNLQIENEAMKRALYVARKHPTKDNVKQYIEMQNKVTLEAHDFSDTWKQVLLENPILNYAIKHPTNNYARMIEEDEIHKKEEAAIHALASTSGLFFFYRSTCAYCRAFAPTVKQFADTYGIKVIAITTDGIPLSQFPDSRMNQGQAENFGIKVEPALFIVNPRTDEKIPVAYGLISLADLKRNFPGCRAMQDRPQINWQTSWRLWP